MQVYKQAPHNVELIVSPEEYCTILLALQRLRREEGKGFADRCGEIFISALGCVDMAEAYDPDFTRLPENDC